MSPADAAKLLDLPIDATPELLEARFLELRRKLEDKIAKAPTPGLQAKYRESLAEITTAFETLTLAADSSALPIAQKSQVSSPVAKRLDEPAIALATAGGFQPAKRAKSGGKEFILVAVVAVVILAAGGWFVMKTRAENAEKARLAAAAKTEQERLAEATRVAAELKKQAEEAERGRLEKLSAQLRADLAEAKIGWEAIEREERTAERRLTELKSDLRNLRDVPAGRLAESRAMVAAQQGYYDWLSDTLARHPAKIARGRAEEMLAARQPDDAHPVIQEMSSALRSLETEISRRRQDALVLDGILAIKTHPNAKWVVMDAFGRVHRGKGPAAIDGVAIGRAEAEFTLPFWKPRKETIPVVAGKTVEMSAEFATYNYALESKPTGATVLLADGTAVGTTPVRLQDLPPGPLSGVLRKNGFREHRFRAELGPTGPSSAVITLVERPTQATLPPSWKLPARLTVENRTQSSVTSGRSTGSYAGAGSDSHHQSHTVEEWDMSDPDESGHWQRVVRKFVRQDGSHTFPVATGTIIEYRRGADGKWAGTIQEGRLTSDASKSMVLDSFTPETWTGLDKLWPPSGTPVGGTWKVPATEIASVRTGRLVSFNKEPARDWVELEFTFNTSTGKEGESNVHSGTSRLAVDLEGYVMSNSTTYRYSTTTKVRLVGVLAADATGSTTLTYTPR
jgi:hypothetical protein